MWCIWYRSTWSVCSRRRLSSHACGCERRQPALVRPLAHLAVDFGGEHDLLPPAAALREPPADDLLREPRAEVPP